MNSTTNAPRTQLKHVLFDVDFLHKPTVKGFRAKFGWVSIPWLFEMYALMSRATNARISHEVITITAVDMGLTNPQEMLDYCLKEELIKIEEGGYTNKRVIDDQTSLAQKQERWRKAKGGNREDSALPPRGNDAEAARKSEDIEVLNTEELNTELINKETVTLPASIDTPENRRLWELWEQRCRKNGRALNEIYREMVWMKYVTRPDDLAIDLKKTLSVTSAKNIIEESLRTPTGKFIPKPSQNVVNQMAGDQVVALFLKGRK